MNHLIDLRSDTVTRPTTAMRCFLSDSPVGDDVYGEDPTVNQLQVVIAEMAGKDAGLIVPSGTMGNLLAILSHCQRGEEYIAGQQAHCYRFEAGGAAVFGGVQPQPIDFRTDGTLCLEAVRRAIKPNNYHFAMTRLLCLENTQAGKVLPLDYQLEVKRMACEYKLSTHLDGARAFNAAIHQGVQLIDIANNYDSVSICLSKGLGAPVGSLLVGSEPFISRARRWRKMAGGGMRQAGFIAAAGLYALMNHVDRLVVDHENAWTLANGLAGIDEISVDLTQVQTNMVFVKCENSIREKLVSFLASQGILVGGYDMLRLVTHLDVNAKDMQTVVSAFKKFFTSCEHS